MDPCRQLMSSFVQPWERPLYEPHASASSNEVDGFTQLMAGQRSTRAELMSHDILSSISVKRCYCLFGLRHKLRHRC
eukprot:5024379-Amphidinium_carterae.1